MPIYLMTCVGCGTEAEILVDEHLGHGVITDQPEQRCSCGGSVWRKDRVSLPHDGSTLWAKQCRTGWVDTPEAKQAIGGKGYDVD